MEEKTITSTADKTYTASATITVEEKDTENPYPSDY